MSSYSFASYLNKNNAYLVVLLIQLILNSVVAAKFLKIKTTKFDPKAYVAMTFVATAVIFVLWVFLTKFVEENDGLAIAVIVVTLAALMFTYMMHTIIVMKRLDDTLKDKTGLQVLCFFNLLFTFIGAYICVISENKEVTYSSNDRENAKEENILSSLEDAMDVLKSNPSLVNYVNVQKKLDILTDNVIDGKQIKEFDELLSALKQNSIPDGDIYLINVNKRLIFIEKINEFIKAMETAWQVEEDKTRIADIRQYYENNFRFNVDTTKLNSDVFKKFTTKLEKNNNPQLSGIRMKNLVHYVKHDLTKIRR